MSEILFDNGLHAISISDEEVLNKELDGLIADEVEAIAGYERAITYFQAQEKNEIVEKLFKIEDEERQHLADLKFIRGISDQPAPVSKEED